MAEEQAVEEVEETAEVEVAKRKFKANGQDFEFSDAEILEQFDEEEGEDHRNKFIVYGWIESLEHVIEIVRRKSVYEI